MLTRLRILASRIAALFSSRAGDADFQHELASHLALLTDENIRRGMPPAEAARAARLRLGADTPLREAHHDLRVLRFAETLRQDTRYAARQLRRSPGFATVAILTLALGIGANTAIFSILDPLLLRKLPVQNPDALVFIGAAGNYQTGTISESQSFRRYRDHNRVFSGVTASGSFAEYTVTRNGRPSQASGELIAANFFSLLGLRPRLGRFFTAQDTAGASPNRVVVLSYNYWQKAFDANPTVIGKAISVDDSPYWVNPPQSHSYAIVGVAPRGFLGMSPDNPVDLYAPMPDDPSSDDWVTIVARLKPGISIAQARASLEPLFEENVRDSRLLPPIERKQDMARLSVEPAGRGGSDIREKFSLPARLLMGVVGLVLLIACANVAGLLVARGAARKREIGMRLALGAARPRVVRQLLTESALLAAAGAVAGVIAAGWAGKFLVSAFSTAQLPIALRTGLSLRVLLFTAAVLVFVVLLSGLAPALSATRGDLAADLKVQASAGARASSHSRMGQIFVVGQVALSVTVLIAAGLLLRSLVNLERFHVGFDADRVLAISLGGHASSPAFYNQLLERARRLPGVRAAAYSRFTPLSGHDYGVTITVAGRPPRSADEAHAFYLSVSPGYFQTMGISILEGRDFRSDDVTGNAAQTTVTPAIVNRTMARHYFPDENPIGKQFKFGEAKGRGRMEIVGVAADSTYNDIREKPADFVYYPTLAAASVLNVRTAGNPALLAAPLRRLIHSLDGGVTVAETKTLRRQLNESLHEDRLIAALCGVFSILALALACVGLYGTLAFYVTRRTAEIGIRMALGAQRKNIFALVVVHGMAMIAAGLLIGLAAALAATRVLSNILFGVPTTDPLTYISVAALLLAVALLACYIPARRATQVDPVTAMRAE